MFAQRPFDMAAFDLDETLLGPDSSISPENLAAVERMKNRGIICVAASGRIYQQMTEFHRQLNLDTPLVSCNGGVVRLGDKFLRECHLAHDVANRILHYAHANKLTALSYMEDGVHITSQYYWNEPAERHFTEGTVAVKFSQPADLIQRRIHQLVLIDTKERLDAIAKDVGLRCTGCNIYRLYDGELLVMIPKDANKAQGVAAVAAYYGIPAERVATFGDGTNDCSMLAWSGFSVAMHHGHPSAKAAAKLTAPDTSPAVNFAAAVDMLLGTA